MAPSILDDVQVFDQQVAAAQRAVPAFVAQQVTQILKADGIEFSAAGFTTEFVFLFYYIFSHKKLEQVGAFS